MENHIFKLQGGSEVELNDIDMQRIHEYFQQQSTADYIRENYPVLTEKKVQAYAAEVRARMDKYDCSEDEAVGHIIKTGGSMDNSMNNIMETMILKILDGTHDGILSLGVLRKNNIQLTREVNDAVCDLIDKGILIRRDCESFAVERAGNTKSRYGEQPFFNSYIHLTRQQLEETISEWNSNVHGLIMHIMDDTGSCINSRHISDKDEGRQYFNATYNDEYTYEFAIKE